MIRRLLALLTTLGLALTTLVVHAPTASAAIAPGPLRLGTSMGDSTPGSKHTVITTFERENTSGQELGAIRLYHAWDEVFPQGDEAFLSNRSSLPVVSVNSRKRDGNYVSWQAIAQATPGSGVHNQMVAWANGLKSFGKRVVVTFEHEPDYYRNGGNGTAYWYVRAAQKFITVLRNNNVTNAEYGFIGVAWNFDPRSPVDGPSFYPGDNYIDWIGVDGYNWGYCRPQANGWRTFESVFTPFMNWAADHPNQRLMVAEFGSVEGTSGRKAGWIDEIGDLLRRPGWNRIEALMWWDAIHQTDRGCNFRVQSTNSSKDAFRRLFDVSAAAAGATTPHDTNFTSLRSSAGRLLTSFTLGRRTDIPLFCDWDGDGIDTPAVIRPGNRPVWFVQNRLAGGTAEHQFAYGGDPRLGDIPICGDWNGDGIDTPGVYRVKTSEFHLTNRFAGGPAQIRFRYGNPQLGDRPVVGDWDGDGVDEPGVFRLTTNRWYLNDTVGGGHADWEFTFGNPAYGDQAVVGDWDGNGGDSIGVYRDGAFYLTNRLAAGNAQQVIEWAAPGDNVPVTGNFDGGRAAEVGVDQR